MSRFESYANQFEHAVLERDDAGVLEIRLHTDGGPLVWGDAAHSELPSVRFLPVRTTVISRRAPRSQRLSGAWPPRWRW